MSRLWTTRAHIFRREIQSHGRFFIVWIHVHPAVCHDGSHGGELANEMNESTWTPSPRWRHEPTWNHPTSKKKDLIDWSAEKSSSGLILLVHLQVSLIYKMKDYTLYNILYIHRHTNLVDMYDGMYINIQNLSVNMCREKKIWTFWKTCSLSNGVPVRACMTRRPFSSCAWQELWKTLKHLKESPTKYSLEL